MFDFDFYGLCLALSLFYRWVRSLEALRQSEADAQGAEIMRLLEEEDDPELGIPSLKKDYVSLDFDGMMEMDDLPTKAPTKPSRRNMKSPAPST